MSGPHTKHFKNVSEYVYVLKDAYFCIHSFNLHKSNVMLPILLYLIFITHFLFKILGSVLDRGNKNLLLISSNFSRIFHIIHLPHFTCLLFPWWRYKLVTPSCHYRDPGNEHFNIFPLMELHTSDFGVHTWEWSCWVIRYWHLILLAISLLFFRMAASVYIPSMTVFVCPHLQ